MEYRAVGRRCAVDISALGLPLKSKEVIRLLAGKGFCLIEVDLITLARSCIGQSQYRRAARLSEAPDIVDCSSLMKWLYGQRGIWLPRRSIQQRMLGEAVEMKEMRVGDVVFISGFIDYYTNDPSDGVGHVGIATGQGTVVHAANSRAGVIETLLDEFAPPSKFRGARRYIPLGRSILTFETPADREVEIADDMRWIVLQNLPTSAV